MTSSSSRALERGLDTMLLVYCTLQGHPAAPTCEQFLRAHTGWFTSPLVLFEAKGILTKVYGVSPSDATLQLTHFSTVPVAMLELDPAAAFSVLQLADNHGLDITDGVLLHLATQHKAGYLATEDQHLAQVCTRLGITPQSPLNAVLRQQVAAWEAVNLAPKGLPRVLRRIQQWLVQNHPQAAPDFLTHTGGGSHLP